MPKYSEEGTSRMMHKEFRAEKDQSRQCQRSMPRLSEERTSSHPQYLDYRDSALQQRQHSLLLL